MLWSFVLTIVSRSTTLTCAVVSVQCRLTVRESHQHSVMYSENWEVTTVSISHYQFQSPRVSFHAVCPKRPPKVQFTCGRQQRAPLDKWRAYCPRHRSNLGLAAALDTSRTHWTYRVIGRMAYDTSHFLASPQSETRDGDLQL